VSLGSNGGGSPRLALSVVIPVFDEAEILRRAVQELDRSLAARGFGYEIVLAENGSRDATFELAGELVRELPAVRRVSLGEPNYGRALREGILAARGDYLFCDEIDLCDADFHGRALELLGAGADLVIGSKLLPGSEDRRPWSRHAASLAYSKLLALVLGFPGTDTHGLKAFRRERLLPIVRACRVEGDVFASELVIRAYRAGLDVREIPVSIAEKRPPSIDLARRVPGVLANLVKLRVQLWRAR
jgi:glycosyltransferase involved in cell wall biosynthesis